MPPTSRLERVATGMGARLVSKYISIILPYTSTKMMMPSACMVSPMTEDWSHSPKREPKSIPSSVVWRLFSISGETAVEPRISPAEREITFCDTSKTAITILNVLESISTAHAVLNIHL